MVTDDQRLVLIGLQQLVGRTDTPGLVIVREFTLG
jgi:hypothetical protein